MDPALERGESWPLIDVRSPEEWVKGHIPGAHFLTLELKFEALDTWPKDTRIVFYSNAGHRSLEVASYFMAYGFTNVRNMAGGLEAWSGELQASNLLPLPVEVSAINGHNRWPATDDRTPLGLTKNCPMGDEPETGKHQDECNSA